MITWSVSAGQSALLVVTSISVSEPLETAAAVGVYVGFNVNSFGLKDPLAYHCPPPAFKMVPPKLIVELFVQLTVSFPAFAIGNPWIFTTCVMVSLQPAAVVVISVTV